MFDDMSEFIQDAICELDHDRLINELSQYSTPEPTACDIDDIDLKGTFNADD